MAVCMRLRPLATRLPQVSLERLLFPRERDNNIARSRASAFPEIRNTLPGMTERPLTHCHRVYKQWRQLRGGFALVAEILILQWHSLWSCLMADSKPQRSLSPTDMIIYRAARGVMFSTCPSLCVCGVPRRRHSPSRFSPTSSFRLNDYGAFSLLLYKLHITGHVRSLLAYLLTNPCYNSWLGYAWQQLVGNSSCSSNAIKYRWALNYCTRFTCHYGSAVPAALSTYKVGLVSTLQSFSLDLYY